MGPRLAFISPLAERCDNNNKWERDVEKKKKILCSSNGDNEGCLLLLCGVCYICSADESLNSFYVGLVCSKPSVLDWPLFRFHQHPWWRVATQIKENFQLLRLMKWNITVYFEYHRVQTLLWCHQVSQSSSSQLYRLNFDDLRGRQLTSYTVSGTCVSS